MEDLGCKGSLNQVYKELLKKVTKPLTSEEVDVMVETKYGGYRENSE